MAWDGSWQIEFDTDDHDDGGDGRDTDARLVAPHGADARDGPPFRRRRRAGVLALAWAVCGVVVGLAAGGRTAPARPMWARAAAASAPRPSTGLPDASAALAMAGAAQSGACLTPR